jgi:hypothetical protein
VGSILALYGVTGLTESNAGNSTFSQATVWICSIAAVSVVRSLIVDQLEINQVIKAVVDTPA